MWENKHKTNRLHKKREHFIGIKRYPGTYVKVIVK